MILHDIIIKKKIDLEEMKRRYPLRRLKEAVEGKLEQGTHERRSFKKALANTKTINLICELKKASPSEGVIREDFQPLRIAGEYEFGGAAAISVLTETHYFKGRPSYLKTVRQVTKLPLLRKDFIFESYQLYESALLEADAYLLIASLLTDTELADLIELGTRLGMDALVEVHTDEDLKKAIGAKAKIIGINNRNLQTLEVDVFRSKRLLPHLPKDIISIVESGIKTHEDIMEYRSLGVNNFLVGTVLMRAENTIDKLKELLGQNKKWKPR